MFEDYTAAIFAGRPVRPEEYATQDDDYRWRLWTQIVETGQPVPPLYPGYIEKPCSECGIGVQIGPRQQEALEQADEGKIIVLCHVDAAMQVAQAQAQGGSATMYDLGNPFKPKEQ